MKVIASNRKARHDYLIEDTFEAGLVLTGTEIKSIRAGSVQLKDSYVEFLDGAPYINGMHISVYREGNRNNHEEERRRKLLLNQREINKLESAVQIKGYTIVPTQLYLTKGLAKLEIALAKGKDLHDKRQSAKERDAKREIEKSMKQFSRE